MPQPKVDVSTPVDRTMGATHKERLLTSRDASSVPLAMTIKLVGMTAHGVLPVNID
jgi:hypothetical protein